MFCPECGCNIGDEALNFCPECGSKVIEVFEDATPAAPATTSSPSRPAATQQAQQPASQPSTVGGNKAQYRMYGVILTNVRLLAEKLETSTSAIEGAISKFIRGKEAAGISYRLADAGAYQYRQKSKQVAMKGGESIDKYLEIIKDVYDYEEKRCGKTMQYLFILGSNDIIPMLTIPHYKKDGFSDKDIDTDIIYGFPYSEDMVAKVKNQEIFGCTQLYRVGRLPVGEDTTMDNFTDYLERAVRYSMGIPMGEAYAQCDPHWKKVTEQVAKNGGLKEWLRNLDGQYKKEVYFNRLMLTPYIDTDNVDQVFHYGASFYYYNLHGSSSRSTSGYVGEYPPHQRQYAMGVTPQMMGNCEVPNVLITESCYGARHIGMKHSDSMVLSALYGSTLVFLGSSRIAWGRIDDNQEAGNIQTSLADTMASAFQLRMLQGDTAGYCLLLSRGSVFKHNRGSEERAATIVEFNLFGDPTLSLKTAHGKGIDDKACETNITTPDQAKCHYKVEKLNEKSSGGGMGSLLGLVRREVDKTLAEIQQQVGENLYKLYGLPPRPASLVYRITEPDGSKVLKFDFEEEEKGGFTAQYSAVTTETGEVLDVLTTK